MQCFNNFREAAVQETVSPVYIGRTGENKVGLMINVDWGEEIIPRILEVLATEKVPVTFFVTGRFAEKQPELVNKMAELGHEIGNHGYSHPHADKLSKEENQKEIQKAEAALIKAGVEPKKYFAVPYGEKKEHVIAAAEELGYKVIYWTLDTVDWQEPSPKTIIKRIVPHVEDGALILAHPKQCTLEALPELIKQIRSKGFEFAPLSQLIE